MQPVRGFSAPIRALFLLAATFLLFALPGCEQNKNAEYDRGYKAGINQEKEQSQREKAEAQEKGYRKGFQEGFEKGYPGTVTGLSGFADSVYKLLVWGGAVKIFLSLLLAMLALLNKGTGVEIVGKVLFAVLGSLSTILIVTYLYISKLAEAVLLISAPSSFVWQVVWILGAAVIMYYVLDTLYHVATRTHKAIVGGWMVFILAGLLTFIAPLLLGLYNNIPDVTKYFAANLLSGALLGGIYYIGYGLLTGKFEVASAKSGES